jgi:serine/threonine protein kinase
MSPKSDIWSLGCILHLLVYGETPFQGISNPSVKMSAIMKGVTFFPPIPPDFASTSVLSVLELCLQKDPKQRPTASELLTHPFLRGEKCEVKSEKVLHAVR